MFYDKGGGIRRGAIPTGNSTGIYFKNNIGPDIANSVNCGKTDINVFTGILIEKEGKEYNLSRDKIEEILCVEEDKNLIILAIVELCKLNIRDFFDCIKSFFKRNVKNIYKVMLIDALRGQGVTNEFIITNNNCDYKVIPVYSENVLESKPYIYIRKMLEDKIGSKEVTVCSMALENLMLYLSDIYPKNLEEEEYSLVACALQYYVSKMYDESLTLDYFTSIYKVDEDKCSKYLLDLESACSI